MAWKAQVGTEPARRGGFNCTLHQARTVPRWGVGVNPPRFFEKKVLVFSAVTGGGGYSQSLIPFYSILYIT